MTEQAYDSQPQCPHCGSSECKEAAAATERRSLDEILDDRLEQAARFKFLWPINPDPVTEMAKELKRKI
jgi:hypothetical protein